MMFKIQIIVGLLAFVVLLFPASASDVDAGYVGVSSLVSVTDSHALPSLQPLTVANCKKRSGGTGCLTVPVVAPAGPDVLVLSATSIRACLSTMLHVAACDQYWKPSPPPPKLH